MFKKRTLVSIVFSILLLLGASISVGKSFDHFNPSAEEEDPGAWVVNPDDLEGDGQGEVDEENQA